MPYPAVETTLANGLKVIVVPTGFPNLVSLQIPVQTGSRNEIEVGKTGFAHFFEHMMFRGTKNYPPDVYQDIVNRAGARQNAYTTDDYTNYHVTFAKEDLEKILEIEADRFQHLEYELSAFQTEARAVLGEYNKNYSNPIRKLFEKLQDTAFTTHTYKHTTMGFIDDVLDMPNQYDYSREFFQRWYRPEITTIIVAGDVDADTVIPLVEKYWGAWKPGVAKIEIPQEPEPTAQKFAHVEWASPTLPLIAVSFLGPKFSETEPDSAAMELLLQLRFGETSALYQRLVNDEQKVDLLSASNADSEDPNLITILARPKSTADLVEVRDAILKTCAETREALVTAEELAQCKSNLRYGFSATLDNTDSIASTLARYVRFRREYHTLNRVFDLFDSLTPEHLQAAARKFFATNRLTVVTLHHGAAVASIERAPELESMHAATSDDPGASRFLVVKNQSPQIAMKLAFSVGSAHDPDGKEGLAALSAKMVSEAGSDVLTYADIQKALYPIAGSFSNSVDREVTVFTGSIHKDNLERFATIVLDQLLRPGLRTEDFERNRDGQSNDLAQDLVANNDEELGKEWLQHAVFAGSGYAHPSSGTKAGIQAITLDDVRRFQKAHYTWDNLTIGISGDVPDAFVERLRKELGSNLAKGKTAPSEVKPRASKGIRVHIVDKETRATSISIGHPIAVTRSHPDFVALWLARTWLGEHRSSLSHLYQRIRELRGMNYGDYAYIEAFPGAGGRFFPPAHVPRRAQLFEMWIRSVDQPEYAHHAIRIALHEYKTLVENGLTEEQFAATRDYLMKNVFLFVDSQSSDLGYRMDAQWYGTAEWTEMMRERLKTLTCADVNAAMKRHFTPGDVEMVLVTKHADEMKRRLTTDAPSSMKYEGEKPKDVLDEDARLSAWKLGIDPANVTVTKVADVFAK